MEDSTAVTTGDVAIASIRHAGVPGLFTPIILDIVHCYQFENSIMGFRSCTNVGYGCTDTGQIVHRIHDVIFTEKAADRHGERIIS